MQNEAACAATWIVEGCEAPIPDTAVMEISTMTYQAPENLVDLFKDCTDADIVRLVRIGSSSMILFHDSNQVCVGPDSRGHSYVESAC